MSLTAITWLLLFGVLTVLAFYRSAYGFSLYALTFLAFPNMWWWGKPLAGYRWNLCAGIIFLLGVIVHVLRDPPEPNPYLKRVGFFAVAMLANATVVHSLLSPDRSISLDHYTQLAKFVLLFFLMATAIRTPQDMRIMLWSMVIGTGYIGYEATINERGLVKAGRLERLGAPGAKNANHLACLLLTVLPVAGTFILTGSRRDRILAAILAAFALNLILLCNSRGALLALICAAAALMVLAKGRIRKQALIGLALGGIVTYMLLGDPQIVERFLTTFNSQEELDRSASNRLMFWKAGLRVIADHPFGLGGDGYKKYYARKYLEDMFGLKVEDRAVHNGFINDACEWGIQGLILRTCFIASALLLLRITLVYRLRLGDIPLGFLGACLMASMVGFLVSSFFIDSLDSEWGFWFVALSVGYARLYGPEAGRASIPAECATVGTRSSEVLATSSGAVVAARAKARGHQHWSRECSQ